jgi:hypothetical protein
LGDACQASFLKMKCHPSQVSQGDFGRHCRAMIGHRSLAGRRRAPMPDVSSRPARADKVSGGMSSATRPVRRSRISAVGSRSERRRTTNFPLTSRGCPAELEERKQPGVRSLGIVPLACITHQAFPLPEGLRCDGSPVSCWPRGGIRRTAPERGHGETWRAHEGRRN